MGDGATVTWNASPAPSTEIQAQGHDALVGTRVSRRRRDRYSVALSFNVAAFLLPAIYSTLAKLWVARIDSSMVVTTDVYTYIATIAEVINEVSRASWTTIGDKCSRKHSQRLALAHTLILAQALLGLALSLILLGAAETFAKGFVPLEVRQQSITYVRIGSFSVLSGAIEAAIAAATRALDEPDVALILSCIKFAVNIILDLLLISTFRVGSLEPTVNLQASIQLACNLAAAFGGLAYFLFRNYLGPRRGTIGHPHGPSLCALKILLRPAIPTFVESAIRNAFYLWLVTTIVSLGTVYATAWGVFNTIRWGLVMVPVSALEATTLTFVGHNWGRWRRDTGIATLRPRTSLASLCRIVRPAFISAAVALAFEVPLCIAMYFVGARSFARYLSGSDEVAEVAARMWRTLDYCYIVYAVSTQMSAILLATRPKWYLWQSLASTFLYVLPWTIVCQVANLDKNNAWTYHALTFGGSLVMSFICIMAVLGLWAWTLRTGRAHLEVVTWGD
ncbi:hypothetical protein HRG_009810 [Hirsutella rhossiliensis]|uniref:Uncharacterized protein n=1 Tax=Hirsutella rhossiliensis TaxID=111463 RepID=A0A9P8MQK2_9HYPO|nr:uncharacterized protein HRG_09810 [Hirsutella rhossiliensis]KAH0959349.1 hypothetical protein HRG_09810 [Hirsutella rhossiliensis]